jgi:hypothetical protein
MLYVFVIHTWFFAVSDETSIVRQARHLHRHRLARRARSKCLHHSFIILAHSLCRAKTSTGTPTPETTKPTVSSTPFKSHSPLTSRAVWVHKDFQNRTVKIWENLAAHYKDNTWVAGYNPLNEPTDEEHTRLIDFYVRIEKAIRAVDPDHILFLDGNTFGADFSHFKSALPNSVYACHDYSNYGFPNPPEEYTVSPTPSGIELSLTLLSKGSDDQKARLQRSFDRKVEFMRRVGGPIWNGEFGPVYQNAEDGIADWQEINKSRYQVLEDQLTIYDKANASWSIWLWKDIGFQGMVYVGEETPYIKMMKPFLEKKKVSFGCVDSRTFTDDGPIATRSR